MGKLHGDGSTGYYATTIAETNKAGRFYCRTIESEILA